MIYGKLRLKLEFWHRPDLAEDPKKPFAFVMKAKDDKEEPVMETGIWLSREDIEGYINAMQKALAGEVTLNDGVH